MLIEIIEEVSKLTFVIIEQVQSVLLVKDIVKALS